MSARNLVRAVSTCVLLATLLGAAACKEEGSIKVSRFKFNGLKAVKASQLRSVLATGASSKLPWGEKRYFNREQFDADLKRVVAFYHDRGFPDARVASFDVKLNQDQTSVDLTLTIAEGEPVVAERIEMAGFDSLPADHRKSLEQRLPLKPGQPMDRALIQASREASLDELRDHGFPYASVRLTEGPGSGERRRVLTLTADPGPLAHQGAVEIRGNSSVSDTVIRRQLAFKPGDVFQQSKLLESQRKLYALEVFQFANVQPVREEGEQPVEIPTRVTVTEGKHRKVNFSAGYGTEEKARVEADWRHVNFFGGARTAGVRGRYSALDRGLRLNFTQPYFFNRRYTFGMQGQYWHNDEPAFVMDNVGGRVTVSRYFGRAGSAVLGSRPSTTASLTYANEWEDYTVSEETLADPTSWDDLIALGLNPLTGHGRGQRSSLSLDGGRNTTDNVLDAKRGYLATLHIEQAGQYLGGDYDYYEVTGEVRYYVPVASLAVIALRVRAGAIDGTGDTPDQSVPFYKRYFLGGATNLRGWGRFDVAPLTEGGQPIGGHAFTNFSTELRVPIWGKLSGVLFLDGGNVWANPWDFNLNDMRYDVGPGLRYNTPIGPFRADFGYQLNRIPGLLVNGEPESRRFRFHFSIGQAF
jgi:outer membrane protein assembly complex protein YaeT